MSAADIDRIIALQTPDAVKRKRADVVIRTGLSRFHAVQSIKRWLAAARK
jgi:dephospho-CoA kinase